MCAVGRGEGAGMGVVVFLCENHLKGHFRSRASSWRLLMRGWSVSEDHGTRGRVARAPTRASKAEEEGGKAINGGTPSWRQREGAGQPALLHTNCGSTAQGAHARAQSEVWRS